MILLSFGPFLLGIHGVVAQRKVVIANDDGWAVASIRAQYEALVAAGYDTILSCPAINKSGTGSSSTTPTTLTTPCEFDSCPVGSPAIGFNATQPRLNYVNAYPVDAARYGIQTLAPRFFNASPDIVVSGPNVGGNLGLAVLGSGTVGAACEAARRGIPSVAFSGDSGSQVSYTTLTSDPNGASTRAARIYAALTVKFINTLLASPSRPILPSGVTLNVNYPSAECDNVEDYSFVLSRIFWNPFATDVNTCGSTHLPTETSVVGNACHVSVSVMDANSKLDVSASTQATVANRISSILSCL